MIDQGAVDPREPPDGGAAPDPSDWARRLALEQITLADALMLCLQAGAPVPRYVVERVHAAFEAYQSRQCDDLAEAFGIKSGARERNAMERETLASHVRFHVDEFHAQGFRKADPLSYDNTAFHRAAELLEMKANTVFDIYRGHR